MAGESTVLHEVGLGVRAANARLILDADCHNIKGIKAALQSGADVNHLQLEMGLAALHIAVGNNDIVLCRFLIEECGAKFFPDRSGRWPTLIAAECEVDDALSDYIVEQEARYLEQNS